MNRHYLKEALNNNCLMLQFNRRTEPIGNIRRMICTRAPKILDTPSGRSILKYRPANYRNLPFSLLQKNLIVVWDILMQDYRLIPADATSIIAKVNPLSFWQYFNDKIAPMTKQDKINFMYQQ